MEKEKDILLAKLTEYSDRLEDEDKKDQDIFTTDECVDLVDLLTEWLMNSLTKEQNEEALMLVLELAVDVMVLFDENFSKSLFLVFYDIYLNESKYFFDFIAPQLIKHCFFSEFPDSFLEYKDKSLEDIHKVLKFYSGTKLVEVEKICYYSWRIIEKRTTESLSLESCLMKNIILLLMKCLGNNNKFLQNNLKALILMFITKKNNFWEQLLNLIMSQNELKGPNLANCKFFIFF